MKNALLDTSLLIDFLRREDKSMTKLYRLSKKYQILKISIITHTELYAGQRQWKNKELMRDVEKLLSSFIYIPLTFTISKQAGRLRALYGLSTIDAIIAATALEEHLPLATLNARDFKRVKNLQLLRI